MPSPSVRRASLLLPLVTLAAAAAPAPAPPEAALSAAELARLRRGEVVTRLEPVRRGVPREGVAIGVVDFPPERVYLAVTDFAHYDEFVPFVVQADSAPQPDGSVLSFQRLDLPAPLSDRAYRIRARSRVAGEGAGRVWQVDWRYVPGSGDVEDHRGSWRLSRFGPAGGAGGAARDGGRTLVAVRLFTDPGGAVPDWAMDRATRSSLPWVIAGLRLQARRHRYSAWASGRLLPEPGERPPRPPTSQPRQNR